MGKVLNLEAQRRPPTNPGAFFEVGAVELETTSHMAHPPKPGYVPQVQYPQTAAAYCSSIGAEIATIFSSAENEAARVACGGSSCWIGLSEQGGNVGTSPGNQVWTW